MQVLVQALCSGTLALPLCMLCVHVADSSIWRGGIMTPSAGAAPSGTDCRASTGTAPGSR